MGVSALDYIKYFPLSVLLNFGAFMATSYHTVPLQLAREEQHVISVFSMLNETVLKQPTPTDRVSAISGLNVYNKVHTKEMAVAKNDRLIKCRYSRRPNAERSP